jgi:hypothetical protein
LRQQALLVDDVDNEKAECGEDSWKPVHECYVYWDSIMRCICWWFCVGGEGAGVKEERMSKCELISIVEMGYIVSK